MLFRYQPPSLIVHTPAKLNLFLEVLNKRPDGYHELETLMVSIGLYDTLEFVNRPPSLAETAHDPIQLHMASGPSPNSQGRPVLPNNQENLIVKAALHLRRYANYPGGAAIRLWKRIPIAAGLAGGSSDAAATLAGLNRLWKLNLPREELQALAAQLGSDVPFFLNQHPAAVCRGRGELIEPVALPLGLYFVVVKPPSGLSTPEVFRRWQPHGPRQSVQPLLDELKRGRFARAAKHFYNALEPPAEQLNSEVSQLRKTFSKEPVIGHVMSGSGTAHFGWCGNRRLAELVAARLSSRRIGRVVVARSQF